MNRHVIATVAAVTGVYLTISFVMLDINPADWGLDIRFLTVFLAAWAGLVANFFVSGMLRL